MSHHEATFEELQAAGVPPPNDRDTGNSVAGKVMGLYTLFNGYLWLTMLPSLFRVDDAPFIHFMTHAYLQSLFLLH